MKTRSWFLLLICALLASAGCGEDKQSGDTNNAENNATNNAENNATNNAENNATNNAENNDANNNPEPTGAYLEAKSTQIDQRLDLEGLKHPVHVSFDEWGIPHIMAESVEDVIQVQGYLHARDRLAQMELFRRSTNGTLSELVGAISPSTVSDDIFQRVIGFRRTAEAIQGSLEPEGLTMRTLEAYSRGVNAYIAQIRSGEARVPLAAQTLVSPNAIQDWTPLDSLVLTRFQQYNLGFDAFSELRITRSRAAAQEAFPADSDDPRRAARAGIMGDLMRWAPADRTYQTPGFTGAQQKDDGQGVDRRTWEQPGADVLDRSMRAFAGPYSALMGKVTIPQGASNSWVVSGALTDSGHAMLANDPHLSLDSPALFYQSHLVVEPASDEDGPAMNVFGAIFPGLPGALIGHNDKVAWGLTTASYDYTDVYREQLTWRDGEAWPRVLHNGQEVELEIIEEEIVVGSFGNPVSTVTVQIPIVPHHGPLAPVIDGQTLAPPEGDEALSIAWTGYQVSDEIKAIMGFMTAGSIDDVKVALDDWVIGTQNLVFADTQGNIFKTGESYIPRRPEAARTWDPEENPGGAAPWFVLDGQGEHDWDGGIDRALVPQVTNPEVGYVTTANNDQAGVTDDNNPLNDFAYLGYDYDLGYRAGRIERLLTNATGRWPEGHKLTLEDLGAIQTDTHSNFGQDLSPAYLALLDRALEEYAAAGTHADLTPAIEAHPDGQATLQAMRDLLASWSYEADDGLIGEVTPERIQDSAATALFNFWTARVIERAFDDERAAAPALSPSSQQWVKALLWIVNHPEQAATYDQETGQSALWDDMSTEARETRGQVMLLSLFDAVEQLEEAFGSPDPMDWRWGRLHNRTFESLLPSLGGGVSPFTLPQPEEAYPEGYPRSGDNFNVDACNGGLGGTDYSCGGGAIMRFLVELDPAGVRSFNAQPGGQVWDPDSPHFRDTLEVWLNDQRYQVRFHPDQVAQGNQSHLLFR